MFTTLLTAQTYQSLSAGTAAQLQLYGRQVQLMVMRLSGREDSTILTSS